MKLAEFLARDMLKGIAVPSRKEFALREMERARQRLVKKRKEARQNIRAFLLRNGLEEPVGLDNWSGTALQALQEMPLPEYLRLSLDSYLEEHSYVAYDMAHMRKPVIY
jgi:transposase